MTRKERMNLSRPRRKKFQARRNELKKDFEFSGRRASPEERVPNMLLHRAVSSVDRAGCRRTTGFLSQCRGRRTRATRPGKDRSRTHETEQ